MNFDFLFRNKYTTVITTCQYKLYFFRLNKETAPKNNIVKR